MTLILELCMIFGLRDSLVSSQISRGIFLKIIHLLSSQMSFNFLELKHLKTPKIVIDKRSFLFSSRLLIKKQLPVI